MPSPKETLQSLYKGIMEPHFRYCCSVWGCAGSSEINQLQKLQKRAARIITNSSFDAPSRPLIEKLGWKTVDQLISSEAKTIVCGATSTGEKNLKGKEISVCATQQIMLFRIGSHNYVLHDNLC